MLKHIQSIVDFKISKMVVDRLDVVVTQEKLFKIDRANVSFKISLILFDLRVIVFLTFLRTDSTREISFIFSVFNHLNSLNDSLFTTNILLSISS